MRLSTTALNESVGALHMVLPMGPPMVSVTASCHPTCRISVAVPLYGNRMTTPWQLWPCPLRARMQKFLEGELAGLAGFKQ